MTVGVEKIDVAMPAAEVKIAGRRRSRCRAATTFMMMCSAASAIAISSPLAAGRRRRGRSWRSDEAGPAASEVAA